MKTRPFLPRLFAKLFGEQRALSKKAATQGADYTTNANSVPPHPEKFLPLVKRFSGSYRTRQRLARSPGICRFKPRRQLMTNPKFMSRGQRARFAKGKTIFV